MTSTVAGPAEASRARPGDGRRRGWRVAALLALPTAVPMLVVMSALATPDPAVWVHLKTHVLTRVILNTAWLVAGVVLLAGVLGTTLAWLTAMCDLPGRKLFAWALLLPLAIPGYVIGFVAIGMFEYAGPLQSALRGLAGGTVWLPPVRSRGGVIVVMALALYPYVYLLARNAFLTQGRQAVEAAQSLGVSRWRAFCTVSLPMARPWIGGGMILVAMETLADFGTVSVFNYDTFTTAIYKAWFGLFSINAAMQLASVLLVVVFAVLLVRQALQGQAAYLARDSMRRDLSLIRLRGPSRWLAFAFACAVLGLGFVLPFVQLAVWSVARVSIELDARYLGFLFHSLTLAAGAAVLVTASAVMLAYAARRDGTFVTRTLVRISTLGYALPGTMLAVGIYVPLAALSGGLDELLAPLRGAGAPPLLLQATLLTMLLAYLARFLAVAHSPVESNLLRVTGNLDEAARGMGVGGTALLTRVHLPILRGGVLTAATLVFVDVMKEMPITLMTRPFGWDTLAVRIFEMTSEGEWERAALPAVAIVLVGLVPVRMLLKRA